MRHARALNAFTNPTTNSYRRLRFGQDEPVLLAYAAHNRSAALRIPYASAPRGQAGRARLPRPCANPYLAFAAVLMAGLDGIERRLEPGEPADRNLYDLPPEEAAGMGSVCRSLDEALDALEADHDFLTRGEVMPEELIRAYVRVKRGEIEAVERCPTRRSSPSTLKLPGRPPAATQATGSAAAISNASSGRPSTLARTRSPGTTALTPAGVPVNTRSPGSSAS
jgi:glutamine synthetase